MKKYYIIVKNNKNNENTLLKKIDCISLTEAQKIATKLYYSKLKDYEQLVVVGCNGFSKYYKNKI